MEHTRSAFCRSDGKDLGVDFVVGSGHKSMAAPAPSGILAATQERAAEVFRTTAIEGDVTKRRFGIKEPEMMGCTLMGATLVGMMASFPLVKERVKHFDRELENNRRVLEALLSVTGTKILSEYPRNHTLTRWIPLHLLIPSQNPTGRGDFSSPVPLKKKVLSVLFPVQPKSGNSTPME